MGSGVGVGGSGVKVSLPGKGGSPRCVKGVAFTKTSPGSSVACGADKSAADGVMDRTGDGVRASFVMRGFGVPVGQGFRSRVQPPSVTMAMTNRPMIANRLR